MFSKHNIKIVSTKLRHVDLNAVHIVKLRWSHMEIWMIQLFCNIMSLACYNVFLSIISSLLRSLNLRNIHELIAEVINVLYAALCLLHILFSHCWIWISAVEWIFLTIIVQLILPSKFGYFGWSFSLYVENLCLQVVIPPFLSVLLYRSPFIIPITFYPNIRTLIL